MKFILLLIEWVRSFSTMLPSEFKSDKQSVHGNCNSRRHSKDRRLMLSGLIKPRYKLHYNRRMSSDLVKMLYPQSTTVEDLTITYNS